MKRLYFMRHGLSIHNQIGKFSGRINSPLTDEGRRDVKKSAESIKHLSIDTIVSSPLSRAYESAEIVANVISYPPNKIIVNDLFSERDFGELEGTPYSPIAVRDDVVGIETVEELIQRAQKGFDWLNTLEAEEILLVSHGAMGRALRYVVSENIPFNHPVRFHNAEIINLI
jgi:broad specificity phosphatase PhoE